MTLASLSIFAGALLIAAGLGIYGLACLVLGAARLSDVKAALRRKAGPANT